MLQDIDFTGANFTRQNFVNACRPRKRGGGNFWAIFTCCHMVNLLVWLIVFIYKLIAS
jgi:hypothetical protein